jgi:hypothetical protein
MKLINILEKENNALIFEQHMKNSRTILSESVEGMNAVQRAIVEGIYNDLKPLIEASLTADQVQQLFKGVEQNVSATGNNRTLVGKGKDAVGKVNDTINKVGRWLQDTTPVKAADQKFTQLKSTIGTKFPELDKQLTGLGSWMKENPGKSAAIIGVMTAIAALATGPVGGALAGQILRGSSELIKGSKLSTAVGKGLKTAAVGAAAGGAVDAFAGGADAAAGAADVPAPKGDGETFGLTAEPEEVPQTQKTPAGNTAAATPRATVPADAAPAGNTAATPRATVPADAAPADTAKSAVKAATPTNAAGAADMFKVGDQTMPKGLRAAIEKMSAADRQEAISAWKATATDGVPQDVQRGAQASIDELVKKYDGAASATADAAKSTAKSAAASGSTDLYTVGNQTMKPSLRAAIEKMSAADQKDAIANWRVLAGDAGTQAKVGAGENIEKLISKYQGGGAAADASTSASASAGGASANASAGAPVRDLSAPRPSDTTAFAAEKPAGAPVRDLSAPRGSDAATVAAEKPAPKVSDFKDKVTTSGDTTTRSTSGMVQGITQDQIRNHPVYQSQLAQMGNTPNARQMAATAARLAIMRGESIVTTGKKLSEGQVYLVFDRVCTTNNRMLSEGKIWEAESAAAPKMSTWEKIKTKASEFGKNLTTKVTASKLNSAWKAANEPTDSEELAAFLVKQGVNAEVVNQTFADMKLPKPKAAQATTEKKPAAEKPATDAGQDAATVAPAATTPTPSTTPATTPTVEKPAVSTSAGGGDVDATPQPNAVGGGTAKNTNTLYSQIRAEINQLDRRSKRQLMTYLEKQIGA